MSSSELALIGAFITAWLALTDAEKALTTLTLDDGADVAPSFANDTGDAISGTVGTGHRARHRPGGGRRSRSDLRGERTPPAA